MTAPAGTVYLLHFDRPYGHARHYTGWTEDLLDRLDTHARGRGARLMAVISQAGIGFTLVRVCEGTRRTERAIKREGGAVRFCPACTPRPWNGPWGEVPADLVPRYYPCRPPAAGPAIPVRQRQKVKAENVVPVNPWCAVQRVQQVVRRPPQ